MRLFLPASFVVWMALSLSCAVEAQDQTGFRLSVRSHIVLLPVTVRDSKGELMQSLTRDDFRLFEDGHPQKIRYFDLEKDRPLTLGLLVDMSGSVREFVKKEHEASDVFFDTMLRKPEDTAFLVRFDSAVTMMQSPTSSRDKLRAAVERLEEHHEPKRAFRDPTGMSIKGNQPPGTLLYDAMVVVSDMVSKTLPGRKALVVLSDGEDWGSQKSLAAAIEAVQQADTVVYTILYSNKTGPRGPRLPGGPPPAFSKKGRLTGQDVMELIAWMTGGHAYEVSKGQPLETIYAEIAEEMRMQYTLSYVPEKGRPGYRRIELKAKDKGMQIQTRFGYYAKE